MYTVFFIINKRKNFQKKFFRQMHSKYRLVRADKATSCAHQLFRLKSLTNKYIFLSETRLNCEINMGPQENIRMLVFAAVFIGKIFIQSSLASCMSTTCV